jgi:acyl carrier protein
VSETPETSAAIGVVTAAWCAVLNTDEYHPDDDFFALGGNSLLAVSLVERIERELQVSFPLDALFLDGTLAAVTAATVEQFAARRTPAT